MFTIRSWMKYQHYGDKKEVPWIKLHYRFLSSEDYTNWDNDTKILAIVCMLIASQNAGKIPENPRHVQRIGNLDKLPDFKPLIDCGFLVLENSRDNQNESRQILDSVKTEISDSYSISSSSSSSLGKGGMGEKPSKPKPDYSEEFLSFWQNYPRKQDKPLALKAYTAARKKVDHETISRGLASYLEYCAREGKSEEYIFKAHNWLTNEAWANDYNFLGYSKTKPNSYASNVLAGAARLAQRFDERFAEAPWDASAPRPEDDFEALDALIAGQAHHLSRNGNA